MMTNDYRLVQLKNGIYSVHSLAHRETFHPVIGPAAEAEALYVRQLQLPERMRRHPGEFVVWDVGLGAAANALTVLRHTRGIPGTLRMVSFDHTLEPLAFASGQADKFAYFHGYEDGVRELLQRGHVRFGEAGCTVDWEVRVADFPSLMEQQVAQEGMRRRTSSEPRVDEQEVPLPKPDAILFDAYSPATNPAMWTLPLFKTMYRLLDPQRPCAMATYSRSTLLRVTLLLAGFYVGAGHATGEKEETTVAANTLALVAEPLNPAWLNRVRRSTSAEPLREPAYRQAPLTTATWDELHRHPQFNKAQA